MCKLTDSSHHSAPSTLPLSPHPPPPCCSSTSISPNNNNNNSKLFSTSSSVLMVMSDQHDNNNNNNNNNSGVDDENDGDSSGSSNRKTVRFGSNTEHIFEKQFTKEDHPSIWYTGDEFAAIKNGIYAMIRSLNNGFDDNDDICQWHWRGFEHIQQRRPRKEIRRKHVDDLLYYQKMMLMTSKGVREVDDLGLLAASNSRDSSQRARDLGLLDQMEANEIYYGPNRSDDDDVPDAESISEFSESSADDEDDELYQNNKNLQHPKAKAVAGSNIICREGDDKSVHLLGDHNNNNMMLSSGQDDSYVLSLLYDAPYKLAVMIFPCIC